MGIRGGMSISEGMCVMHVDLKFLSRKFWADTAGIVTVQMVMFSVLLFGGVGLMMDFGRAYSAHSQMQGFIDQVALAAAGQLDGKDDSITRATAAALAVSKSSALIQGGGAFQLHELVFMEDAPTDPNGDFSNSLAATYSTTVPEIARYVLARAVSSSVSAKMLNFGQQGGGNGIAGINIAASAVAKSRTVACGGMSPILMCNPFENSPNTSWQEQMENGIGYRMKLTADIVNGSKPSNFSGATSQLRLGLLKSPDTLMEFRNQVCSDSALVPGMGTTTKAAETLRDICMVAVVETGLSCVNDRVAFKGADPETITTGLDVIFDMYEDSMASVLDPTADVSYIPNLPGASSTTRSSQFYPDLVPSNGRMNREDYQKFLDDEEQEVLDNANIPFFLKNTKIAAINARRAAYPIDLGLAPASRYNSVFSVGQRSEWGPVPEEPCLVAENCPFYPVINANQPSANDVEAYAAAYYAPHFLRQIQAANPATYANWWDVPPNLIDATLLVNGRSTYYSFYQDVERVQADLQLDVATDGNSNNGILPTAVIQSPASGLPNVNPNGYGQFGIQAGARNYPAVFGPGSIGNEERRTQRITVVNCEAAESYASVTGDTSTGFADTYVGDVVDVIDVYLLTPPQVKSCVPAPSSDPEGNNLCANEDITRTDLDVELVDAASINSVNFDSRFYAVLVH